MASTTQTTNYGLPIYQQSDKASWVDTNEPFSAIDTALKGAVTLGESLSPVVAQNTSNIETLQVDLTAVTADVNTIKNTTLPAMQNEIDGAETAAGTSYNNTDSGLAATNVQNAIDELSLPVVLATITGNGTLTYGQALVTFYDTLQLYYNQTTTLSKIILRMHSVRTATYERVYRFTEQGTTSDGDHTYSFILPYTGNNSISIDTVTIYKNTSGAWTTQILSSGINQIAFENTIFPDTDTYQLIYIP